MSCWSRRATAWVTALDAAGSEGPATAYATVYPLTMILRIVLAQVLVVLLCLTGREKILAGKQVR